MKIEKHGKKPLKDKDDHNQTPPSVGAGILLIKKMSFRKGKTQNATQVIQTVGGSVKENINMFLHMGLGCL